ncbi:MAG TPA: hypothetical protein VE956_00090 [Nodularia sp. (in: cyanobacteria)]|nr:hypothetical protein [Nodularia sp. (in: cyanobacteria)]
MRSENIQAVTPLVLGAIAGFIAIAIVFAPNMSDARAAAGFGLAGTAIGTAGGLAQSKGINLDKGDT